MTYDKGERYIRADKLAALLASLPAHYEIAVNRVGNLAICDGPGMSIGYIDIADESIDMFIEDQET